MKTLLVDYKSINSQIEALTEKRKQLKDEILATYKNGDIEGSYKIQLSKRVGNVDYKKIIEDNGIEFDKDSYRLGSVDVVKIVRYSKNRKF